LEKGRFALGAGFSGALKAIAFHRHFQGGKQRPFLGQEPGMP
jgi:hypothetical protein